MSLKPTYTREEMEEVIRMLTAPDVADPEVLGDRCQVTALKNHIDELNKDKARLDFVDKHHWTPEAALRVICSDNIRAAIDAAMNPEHPSND